MENTKTRVFSNAVLSPTSLVLAAIAYIVLVQAFGSFVLINATGGKLTQGFDWGIFQITKGAWQYASLDIASTITTGIPVLLLTLAILFGVRALRNKEAVKWQRMVAIISITLSICLFGMVGIGAILVQ